MITAGKEEEPMKGKKLALILMGSTLIAFAGVTAFAMYDRAHLKTIESIEEPTAVGDTKLFRGTFVANSSKPVAQFGGANLLAGDRVKARDTSMIKAGLDDTRSFFVYRSGGQRDPAVFYLKLESAAYLECRIDAH
jgi:hypothetical protein